MAERRRAANKNERAGSRSRVLIRYTLLGLAVVSLGVLCATLLPHFLNPSLDESNSSANSSQCNDTSLRATTVDTTLSMSGDSEEPSFSSDTTFTVPKNWRGVASLTSSSSDDARYRDAVECFLPANSQAYRPSPPTVSVGDSGQAKKKKEHLVGDRITLEDYAENSDSDSTYPPSDLGVWYLSYNGSSLGNGEPFPYDCSNQPEKFPKSYLLAVLCPVSGATSSGQWTVHLNLQGVGIASSSSTPVQYSGGDATWKLSGFRKDSGFWVELKPDRPSGVYLFLQGWHYGGVPKVSGIIGWTIFFSLLLFAARRARTTVNVAGTGNAQAATRALLGVSICAIAACVLTATADAIWAFGSVQTPDAAYARVESILVFILVAAFWLQAWEWRWRKFFLLLGVAIVSAVVYFGPGEIRLATIPILSVSPGPGMPAPTLDRWQVMGYLNHLFIGVALVALLIAGALSVGEKASRQITPALIEADDSLRSRASHEKHRKQFNYWPSRPVRWTIGVLFGMAVVLQWIRIAYDQWDHSRLFPGAPVPMKETSYDLLSQFPWFPDFLLHWTPALLYYPAIICAVLVLIRFARVDARQGRTIISPASPATSIVALIFAAGVVGIYGSYRSIQVPIAFLVSLALMRVVIRGTGELEKEIKESKEREGEFDLERLQKVLLNKLRAEAQESDQLGGETRNFSGAIRRWWSRCRGGPTVAAERNEARYTDQELALAIGPRIGWWGNAIYAAKIAALLAIPFIAYDIYQNYHNGTFAGFLQDQQGLLEVVQWVFSEILTWVAAGFALGALWPTLPGGRGVYKGLALSAVVVVSSAADGVISHALRQSTWDIMSWSILIFSFIEIAAIILDVSTLKRVERERWEFVDYLRLRDTRWVATYGAVAIIVIFTIVQQIRSGQPISNVPASVINSVLKVK